MRFPWTRFAIGHLMTSFFALGVRGKIKCNDQSTKTFALCVLMDFTNEKTQFNRKEELDVNMQQFKRGDICKRATPLSKKRTPDYYLIMRVIDPDNVLVASIYEKCDSTSISCRLTTGDYKINYASLRSEKSRNFIIEQGVVLYSSKKCINEVYEKSRDYRHQCFVRSIEKKIEAKRQAKEFKELQRLRRFDLEKHECAPVPSSVSWYASHPFQGGLVSPK